EVVARAVLGPGVPLVIAAGVAVHRHTREVLVHRLPAPVGQVGVIIIAAADQLPLDHVERLPAEDQGVIVPPGVGGADAGVGRDIAQALQVPALADPGRLGRATGAGAAVRGGAGVAQSQAGLEAARTSRRLDRDALGGRAGEGADLE